MQTTEQGVPSNFFSTALDKEHSKKKTIDIFLFTLFPVSQNTFSLSLFCGLFYSFLIGFSSPAPPYTRRAIILSSFCELSNSLLPYLRLAMQFEKSFCIVFSHPDAEIRNLENFQSNHKLFQKIFNNIEQNIYFQPPSSTQCFLPKGMSWFS